MFVLVYTQLLKSPLLFASFASSIFAIIGHPKSHAAQTKVVLASQIMAALTGYGLTFVFGEFSIIGAAISVAIISFLMIFFKVMHPPAAGTALAFIYNIRHLSSMSNFLIALLMILCLGIIKTVWHIVNHFMKEAGDEVEDIGDWWEKGLKRK